MSTFFETSFSWGHFLLLIIGQLILAAVLRYTKRVLSKTNIFARSKWQLDTLIRTVELCYEPLSLLLLAVAFVWIQPMLHGLAVVLLFLVIQPQIKDYFTGFFVRKDSTIAIGNRLRHADNQGVISEVGRLGLRIKTKLGNHFLAYSMLFSEGYIQLSGEQIGGFYKINVKPKNETSNMNHQSRIFDLLATAPYLDWNHKPEIKVSNQSTYAFDVRVLVKEQSHLQDLMALMNEWGYLCALKNN